MILVFDLDGTLIDSAPDIHAAANRLLAEEGLPPQPFERVRAMIGHGVPYLIDRLMQASHMPPDQGRNARLVARYSAGYEAAVDLTRPYPYVHETLDRLAAAGHRMGLCTNKPLAAVRAVLAHFDLAQYFPVIVAGDSAHPRKPPRPAARRHRRTGRRARPLCRRSCGRCRDGAGGGHPVPSVHRRLPRHPRHRPDHPRLCRLAVIARPRGLTYPGDPK